VIILPEISHNECPQDDDKSDLDSMMSDADWKTLEEYSNLREFAYEEWTDELLRGRVRDRPPLDCIVARTFFDMSTGELLVLGGVGQYRVPCAFVDDRVDKSKPLSPIDLGQRILLRTIHYCDPMTWRPKGGWAQGRYVLHTKPTTRPTETWPELWSPLTRNQKRASISEWGIELEAGQE
jgi:hypothetical protein